MRRSSLRRRVVGTGIAVALVSSLLPILAAPAAAGTSVVVGSPLSVPRGGQSATTTSIKFSETAVNEIPTGPWTVVVNIAPSSGPVTDVAFVTTTAPTVGGPAALGLTVAWTGNQQFTVSGTGSNAGILEDFTVGNLNVRASGTAALGEIITTYTTTGGFPAGVFDTERTAWATLQGPTIPGLLTVTVLMDTGSADFAVSDANNSQARLATGLVNQEDVALVAPVNHTQISATFTQNYSPGERIYQTQKVSGRLISIGSIPTGAPVTMSIYALSKPSVVRGGTSQAAGTVVIAEVTGHPLIAGQSIHFSVASDATLGTPGATFAATPIVTPNTSTSGITATVQNVTSTGFDVVVGTAASAALGTLTISNILLNVVSNASSGDISLNLVSITGTTFSQTVAVATVSTSTATTLSLMSLSGTSVVLNGSVTLRATLSPALVGQAIAFQAKPAGSSIFATIGTVATTAAGTADLLVVVPMNTTYQAVYAGSTTLGASTSLPLAITVAPTVTLRIAGGYKTALTTTYSTAVLVSNKRYVTLRAALSPAMSNVPVQFWMRKGKSGSWTLVTTGRTDASGVSVWSRVLTTPTGATGYDRYTYFQVYIPATTQYGATWSNSVRGVVRAH